MSSLAKLDSNILKPISVFGTGLLNQLIPNISNLSVDHQRKLNPLVNWSALLNEVAFRSNLYGCFNTELAKRMPTLQWDETVRAFAAINPKG